MRIMRLFRNSSKTLEPRRDEEHTSGLGVSRWFVEPTAGWLMQFRRLRIRYEKRDDIHQAFLIIRCVLVSWDKALTFC